MPPDDGDFAGPTGPLILGVAPAPPRIEMRRWICPSGRDEVPPNDLQVNESVGDNERMLNRLEKPNPCCCSEVVLLQFMVLNVFLSAEGRVCLKLISLSLEVFRWRGGATGWGFDTLDDAAAALAEE